MEYGTTITTTLPFEDALERTRAALGDQGFGVLTEIDVQATMKKKLDKDLEPQVILGPATRTWPSRRCRPTPPSVCCCRATSWCAARPARRSSRHSTRR